MSLEEIYEKYSKPLIGIIGATNPIGDYNPSVASLAGYELRKLTKEKGTLFTGGVDGVGADVCEGIFSYSRENGLPDNFFILVPEGFTPPARYFEISKDQIKIERAGKDMTQRRDGLSRLADILVMINGSMGTLDEGIRGLILGKKVVCMANSSGASEVLCRIKNGEIPFESTIDKDLIIPCQNVDETISYLSRELNYMGDSQ